MIQSHFDKLKVGSIVVINKNLVSKNSRSFITELDSYGYMKDLAGTVAKVISINSKDVHMKDAKTGQVLGEESQGHNGWFWSRDTIRHPRANEKVGAANE